MNAIEARDISISYDQKDIIKNFCVNIKKGLITAIIGPNGAGKSTLLKSFARLVDIKNGNIKIMGIDQKKLSQKQLAQKIAVLLQHNHAPCDMTVEKLIYMGRLPHKKFFETKNEIDQNIVMDAMKKTGVIDFKDTRLDMLSGGQGQRVWLAMAIAQNTDILLLDEPTTYLDISFQIEILKLIKKINRQTNITIIMVLHDLNHALHYADEIIVLNEGRIRTIGDREKIADKQLLREVYNIDSDIINHKGYPYIIANEKYKEGKI